MERTLDSAIESVKEIYRIKKELKTNLVKEDSQYNIQGEAPYNLGYYNNERGIAFFRVGDLLFLDSCIKRDLQNNNSFCEILEDIKEQVIYLSRLQNSKIARNTHHFYSIVTSYALTNAGLENSVVLDLGAAEGVQSLVACRMGAKYLIGVDIIETDEDEQQKKILFWSNIEVNEMDKERFSYINADINKKTIFSKKPSLIRRLDTDDIDVVIATIGPYYGKTDLSAIDLVPYFKNLKKYILGGYVYPKGHTSKDEQEFNQLFPAKALAQLQSYGFEVTSQFWDRKRKSMSLITEHI